MKMSRFTAVWLALILLVVAAIYWPGLSGGWLFDDYSNIVDNKAVQPLDMQIPSLLNAALSSTASTFKRPLASLSFALNYRATGLDPYWMKFTNLVIHLLNGCLVFLLARRLLSEAAVIENKTQPATLEQQANAVALLITGAWLLLPINLTTVLYVVQRMESMANLFVLVGLIGYVAGRHRVLAARELATTEKPAYFSSSTHGLILCWISLVVPTALGLLAKETAVLLPLYALLIEWTLFRGRRGNPDSTMRLDRRIVALFLIVLVLPALAGFGWTLRYIWQPGAWAIRDFTMKTRLLSEARIVLDYVQWTLLPTPRSLSFYHDDFVISAGWLTPWTTLASVLGILALVGLIVWLRRRAPLAALGLAFFVGCHLLTGTILPLELIYEHRNYFASFGLMLALLPLLAAPASGMEDTTRDTWMRPLPYALPRQVLLGALMVFWVSQLALAARVWGSPLKLTQTLALVAPDSPRAQYDLGRSYSIYTNYDPSSPFTPLAFEALEHAASMPKASILPEQALIFMSAKMQLPIKDVWWDHLIAKLKARPPSMQDQGALITLSTCAVNRHCMLPIPRMINAFIAALDHPDPNSELLARYGDYAWNVANDKDLGERMMAAAVIAEPGYPDYHVALIHMLLAQGRSTEAAEAMQQLEALNTNGRLNNSIAELRKLPGMH